MSSWEDCKHKLHDLSNYLQKREVITALGVVVFMGGSFWLFRHRYLKRSLVAQHLSRIYNNVQKCSEQGEGARDPLIIEEQHTIEAHDIRMTYTLVSKLKAKERSNEEAIRNPFLPPFQEGLFIQDLGRSHRLLFNKYNIFNQHLLVTTREFELQSTPLNPQDFKQSIYAFKAMKGLYFYNSGPKAGASQKHKHIQIFPHEARQLPIFRDILEFSRQQKHRKQMASDQLTIVEYPPFKFKHGLVVIGTAGIMSESESDRSKEDSSRGDIKMSLLRERTYRAYQLLYSKLLSDLQRQVPDYNLVGCEEFLLMVPRRKEKAFDQVSLNAVGFMGSTLFKSKQMLRKYISESRHGYLMLEDITFRQQGKQG